MIKLRIAMPLSAALLGMSVFAQAVCCQTELMPINGQKNPPTCTGPIAVAPRKPVLPVEPVAPGPCAYLSAVGLGKMMPMFRCLPTEPIVPIGSTDVQVSE